MSSYGKRKGTSFETGIVKWLRSKKIFAERLTKAGAKDEGDIVAVAGGNTYVLELKATKKIDLPQFWREATVEAENYAKARNLDYIPPKYIILKRKQAPLSKAWVIQDLEQWIEGISE